MFDERTVDVLTGLDSNQRNALVGYYARLDEAARMDAHRRQRELFRDWLAQNRIPPNRGGESNYAALVSALMAIFVEEQRINPASISSQNEKATESKPRKQHKQRLRSSLEKRFLGELIRLREEENLSWRQLSEHFKKQFKKTVSHTYLKRIYDERLLGGPLA